jgi:hypothetical protein
MAPENRDTALYFLSVNLRPLILEKLFAAARQAPPCLIDTRLGGIRHIMLPEAEHRHALLSQLRRGLTVTFAVPINLGLPKRPVLGRDVSAELAPVPKAPINEHSHSLLPEKEVRLAGDAANVELPAANASPDQRRPETDLCRAIALPTNALHNPRMPRIHLRERAIREFVPQFPLHSAALQSWGFATRAT